MKLILFRWIYQIVLSNVFCQREHWHLKRHSPILRWHCARHCISWLTCHTYTHRLYKLVDRINSQVICSILCYYDSFGFIHNHSRNLNYLTKSKISQCECFYHLHNLNCLLLFLFTNRKEQSKNKEWSCRRWLISNSWKTYCTLYSLPTWNCKE